VILLDHVAEFVAIVVLPYIFGLVLARQEIQMSLQRSYISKKQTKTELLILMKIL